MNKTIPIILLAISASLLIGNLQSSPAFAQTITTADQTVSGSTIDISGTFGSSFIVTIKNGNTPFGEFSGSGIWGPVTVSLNPGVNTIGVFGNGATSPSDTVTITRDIYFDTDGDGYADLIDACPNDAGSNNGCPDTNASFVGDIENVSIPIGTSYVDETPVCQDPDGTERTVDTLGSVNTDELGTYDLVYSCTGTNGVEISDTRQVHVLSIEQEEDDCIVDFFSDENTCERNTNDQLTIIGSKTVNTETTIVSGMVNPLGGIPGVTNTKTGVNVVSTVSGETWSASVTLVEGTNTINVVQSIPGGGMLQASTVITYDPDCTDCTSGTDNEGSGDNQPTPLEELIRKNGGGGSDWQKKPTFGKSHEVSSAQLVQGGFDFNGYTIDITDNWHTDFILTSSIIGEKNTVTMKTYAPDGLKYVELSLGVPQSGDKADAETNIQVKFERNYDNPNDWDIIEIVHEQSEPLINESSTRASIQKIICNDTHTRADCYSISIDFTVDAPLSYDVVAITAVDTKRRSNVTYVNEGVEFLGESLLAPATASIYSQ